MQQPDQRAASLLAALVTDTLQRRTGRTLRLGDAQRLADTELWLLDGSLGNDPLSLVVAPVMLLAGTAPYLAAKASLETWLSEAHTGGYLLWVPPGADLPGREPHRSDLLTRVSEKAATLAAGGHGEVRFPITLTLRKSDDEGTYMTVRGGLAPLWARFTGRVFGHYQLDSSELHRLPRGEGYATTLIDRIALEANAVSLGQSIAIEAEDAWVLQRLSQGEGFAILGEPPDAIESAGAPLRKRVRRALQSARPALMTRDGLRILLFVGPYADPIDQPVGTALLGMDPTLYGGLDLVLLAADGEVTPLLELSRSPLLAAVETGPGASAGWGV